MSTVRRTQPYKNARAIALTNVINRLSVSLSRMQPWWRLWSYRCGHPNDIVASNYLPLAGGTLTGTLTGTNAVFTGTLGVGTTTPSEDFAVANRIYVGGTGTSTIQNNFSILGSIAIGNVCINCDSSGGFSGAGISASATSTFSAPLIATYVPPNAHTFPAWSIGASGSNVTSASLVINPASASSDTNLLGVAVNGAVRFLVDAEGDVFANSLPSVGGETLSTTTIATRTVEKNSTLGEATTTDRVYFNSRIGSSLIPTANNILNIGDTTNGLAWRTGIFGTSLGVGTTSPSWPLAVAGAGSFDDYVRASYFNATSSTATSTFSGGLTANNIKIGSGTYLFNAATSSFTQGINISDGCFSVDGVCVVGRVTSVTANANNTLTISPTFGDVVAGLNLSNPNTWTGLQQFSAGASTTRLSVIDTFYVGGTATTTLQGNTTGTSTIQGFLNVMGTNSTSTFSGGIQATYLNITGTIATSTFANGISLTSGCFRLPDGSCAGSGGGSLLNSALTKGYFVVGNDAGLSQATSSIFLSSTGNFGIGTTSPRTRLSVTNTVSSAQVSIAYDAATYATFQVDSVGDLIGDPQGNDFRLNDDNLWVCASGACLREPGRYGNLIIETAIGIAHPPMDWYELAVAEISS